MKLDLGCGTTKQEGWIGLDSRPFPGVDHVLNIGADRWPFDDCSVDEARASHVVEHLKPQERIHFVNELYRVLKPGKSCQIITPHWASTRAYGDLTHEWPPVCEFWYAYLDAEWRKVNAPHNDAYTCNFTVTSGYSMHPELLIRSQDHQFWALKFLKEAAQDLAATVTKK